MLDGRLHDRRCLAAGQGSRNDEEPDVGAHVSVDVDVLNDLGLVHQRLLHAGGVAQPEQRRRHTQRRHVGRRRGRREPGVGDGRQWYVRPLLRDALRLVPRGLCHVDAGNGGCRPREAGKVTIDPGVELGRLEVAGHDQHGVVGPVVGGMELLHVANRGRVEILDAADGGAMVGMLHE